MWYELIEPGSFLRELGIYLDYISGTNCELLVFSPRGVTCVNIYIFAEYMPLASQNPYPFVVYSVAML